MRRLTPLVLALTLPLLLGGCGLLNKVAQPPMRLLQAGARTIQ